MYNSRSLKTSVTMAYSLFFLSFYVAGKGAWIKASRKTSFDRTNNLISIFQFRVNHYDIDTFPCFIITRGTKFQASGFCYHCLYHRIFMLNGSKIDNRLSPRGGGVPRQKQRFCVYTKPSSFIKSHIAAIVLTIYCNCTFRRQYIDHHQLYILV